MVNPFAFLKLHCFVRKWGAGNTMPFSRVSACAQQQDGTPPQQGHCPRLVGRQPGVREQVNKRCTRLHSKSMLTIFFLSGQDIRWFGDQTRVRLQKTATF